LQAAAGGKAGGSPGSSLTAAQQQQRRPGRGTLQAAAAAAVSAAPEAPSLPFRVGHGWDLHRLEPGYPLIVGGVEIPHDRGCVAHSGESLCQLRAPPFVGRLATGKTLLACCDR
jgi:2-C-methyl-D-erythritol 2,4-cyclodiphosphate synthase